MGLRHLVLVAFAIVVLWWSIRVGLVQAESGIEHDLVLLFMGAVLTVGVQAFASFLNISEAYQQGAYTERAKAVQEVLQKARVAKAVCVEVMCLPSSPGKPINTPFKGVNRKRILDKSNRELLELAWHHRVWIGHRGESAVRAFIRSLDKLALSVDQAQKDAELAVEKPFGELETALMQDLGYWPA